MSEAKKPAAMVEIHPGSPEWQAWLTYHRGTKSEARMMLCLGGKTKAGDVVPPRPWLARSKMPPAPPSPSGIRPSSPQVAGSWAPPTVHASAPEGRIDQIVERMTVTETRHAKEADIKKRQRKEAKRTEDVLDAALKSVAANNVPYINGVENLGTLRVPDPLEEQEIIRAGRGHFTVKKRNAPPRERVVSLRDDPIGQMAKRGHLGSADERDIRLKAARHWQMLYERAEIGGARAIDPTRDVVDGGRFELPDTEVRLTALATLNQLCQKLYLEDGRLVAWVLEEKRTLKEYASLFGKAGTLAVPRLGDQLNRALDEVALFFGYRTVAPRARFHRDVHATVALGAQNLELHRAIQRARKGQ